MGYSFIIPFYIDWLNPYPLVNKILLFISLFIIFLIYVANPSLILNNNGLIIIILYYLSLFFSNYINASLNLSYLLSLILSIGFALLLGYAILNKNELLSLLLALKILIYLYALLNIILIFIYPEGIPSVLQERGSRYYLFGNVNVSIRFLLPGLLFSMLYDVLKKDKVGKGSWLLLIITWITLIKTWAVTAMFGLFFYSVIILLNMKKTKVYFAYIGALIGSIIMTVFLVFFKIESNLLAEILLYFEKDLTFSSRDVLWMNAVDTIKQSIIWGYGDLDSDELGYFIGNRHGSHNYYLDILLRGGIVSASILLVGLLYMSTKIIRSKGSFITNLLVASSGAYFVMWMAEPFIATEYLMFSILFVLMSQINRLEKYYLNRIESNNQLGAINDN